MAIFIREVARKITREETEVSEMWMYMLGGSWTLLSNGGVARARQGWTQLTWLRISDLTLLTNLERWIMLPDVGYTTGLQLRTVLYSLTLMCLSGPFSHFMFL